MTMPNSSLPWWYQLMNRMFPPSGKSFIQSQYSGRKPTGMPTLPGVDTGEVFGPDVALRTMPKSGFQYEEMGGRMWLVYYSPETGLEIPDYRQDLGPITKEPSENVAFQREQLESEERRGQAALQEATQQRAASQLYGRLAPPSEAVTSQQKAQIYEQVRQEIMAGLQSPREWIKYMQVKQSSNPYQPQPSSLSDNLDKLREEYKVATELAKEVRDTYDPARLANPRTTEEQLAGVALERERTVRERLLEANALLQEGQGRGVGVPTASTGYFGNKQDVLEAVKMAQGTADVFGNRTVGEYTKATSTMPEIPDWLRPFVPGLAKEKYVKQTEVGRPSAQSWLTMPYAQREMLMGLMEYSGQSPTEMMETMALERPQEARTPTRSTAFRQR